MAQNITLPKSLAPEEMSASETEFYKAINYEGLIPILTASIQELDDQVSNQKELILELNDTIRQLNERLAALENK